MSDIVAGTAEPIEEEESFRQEILTFVLKAWTDEMLTAVAAQRLLWISRGLQILTGFGAASGGILTVFYDARASWIAIFAGVLQVVLGAFYTPERHMEVEVRQAELRRVRELFIHLYYDLRRATNLPDRKAVTQRTVDSLRARHQGLRRDYLECSKKVNHQAVSEGRRASIKQQVYDEIMDLSGQDLRVAK